MRVVALCPVALLLLAFPTSAQHTAQVAARLARIRRDFPCVDSTRIPIAAIDPTLRSYGCSLASMAVHEIALGHADVIGFLNGDSSRIQSASIRQMKFKGLSGASDGWYWVVTLSVPDRPRKVEIVISQLADSIHVQRTRGISGN